MKLHEVLEKLDGNTELWFRPISWKGRESAYTLDGGGCTKYVPTSFGGNISMTPSITLLKGDWEIVTPDQVLNGG